MTIQAKTTLLFTLITAGLIFAVSLVVYFFSSKFAFRDFYKRLEIRAYVVARAMLEKNESSTVFYEEIRSRHLERLTEEREYLFEINNGNVSKEKADSAKIPLSFLQRVAAEDKGTYFHSGLYYSGVLYHYKQRNYIVVVSARNDYGDEVLHNLREVLLICWVASILIVFTLGLFFSKTIFQPIRNITSSVKEMSAANLHLRLPANNGHDEIAMLSDTFNDLLSRLEVAFDIQKNFVSNASHELRTPLTAIIGEADLALYKDRDNQSYRYSLEVILKEAEKLQNLTNSLLMLAQTDASTPSLQTEMVRLDDLLLDVKKMVEKMHEEYDFKLVLPDISGHVDAPYVMGSYPLLRLAVSNVVLNAFKYSSSPVTVGLERGQKKHAIVITDEGIGIPEDEMKYIFVPFFRASNTGKYDGHGIGLPLTINIIRVHGGEIVVQSAINKGTKISIILPSSKPYA